MTRPTVEIQFDERQNGSGFAACRKDTVEFARCDADQMLRLRIFSAQSLGFQRVACFYPMFARQGSHACRSLAALVSRCHNCNLKHMEIIMTSQREHASRFEPRFIQQLWNAILLVQTRETANLTDRRGR